MACDFLIAGESSAPTLPRYSTVPISLVPARLEIGGRNWNPAGGSKTRCSAKAEEVGEKKAD